MKIPYRIPKGYILFILAISIVLPLGAFGYIDDSFIQTAETKLISAGTFLGILVYFFSTPRNRNIIVSEQGISVPRVLIPPYVNKSCNWKDITSYELMCDESGSETLILRTRLGEDIKIYSLLCFKDYELSFQSDAFDTLYEHIMKKIPYTPIRKNDR